MAELRRTYESQDDIPDEFRELYTERDGTWVLQLTGTDPFSKPLDEFERILKGRDAEREKSASLEAQIKAVQDKLGDINPDHLDSIAEMLKKVEDAEQQTLIDEKRFEEAAELKFQRRIAEMERELQNLHGQIEQKDQSYTDLMNKHGSVRIEEGIRTQLLAAGADPSMVDYIVTSEARRWEINPATLEPEPVEWIDGGKTKITAVGADGQPLTMKEQAESWIRENPKFALDSNGSHATHQISASGSGAYQIRESEVNAPDGHARYQKAREDAQKAGQELEVIPG